MKDFIFKPFVGNSSDTNNYKKIFDENGSPKKEEVITWMHSKNPFGKTYVDFAITNNEEAKVAAVYATFPVNFKIDGKIMKACQSIDTMTDQAFRGSGLFIKLAKSVYQRCKDDDLALVYGFPNQFSAKGFFKLLNWKPITEVPFIIKPLNTKYFFEKVIKNQTLLKFIPNIPLSFNRKVILMSDWEIKTITYFDSNVNELWNNFSNGIDIAIERNSSYLNWRFFDKPAENYKVKGLYLKNELVAFIIYCVKEKHNGKIGYIMEFLYKNEYAKESKALLQTAINEINLAKADLTLAWCFQHSPNYSIYKQSFFWNLPEKLRPIKLNFGAAKFSENIEIDLTNPKSWYISYCDSDTV